MDYIEDLIMAVLALFGALWAVFVMGVLGMSAFETVVLVGIAFCIKAAYIFAKYMGTRASD